MNYWFYSAKQTLVDSVNFSQWDRCVVSARKAFFWTIVWSCSLEWNSMPHNRLVPLNRTIAYACHRP